MRILHNLRPPLLSINRRPLHVTRLRSRFRRPIPIYNHLNRLNIRVLSTNINLYRFTLSTHRFLTDHTAITANYLKQKDPLDRAIHRMLISPSKRILRHTANRQPSIITSPLRRMPIIQRRSRNSKPKVRSIFRRNRNLNIRVINQLVRRRRIHTKRRYTRRIRPTRLTSKRVPRALPQNITNRARFLRRLQQHRIITANSLSIITRLLRPKRSPYFNISQERLLVRRHEFRHLTPLSPPKIQQRLPSRYTRRNNLTHSIQARRTSTITESSPPHRVARRHERAQDQTRYRVNRISSLFTRPVRASSLRDRPITQQQLIDSRLRNYVLTRFKLQHPNEQTATRPNRFLTGGILPTYFSNLFLLFTLNSYRSMNNMTTLMTLGPTPPSLPNTHNRLVRRPTIINSSSRNAAAFQPPLRMHNRPPGNLSIRIINKFVRRRSVKLDRRHHDGNGPARLSATRLVNKTFRWYKIRRSIRSHTHKQIKHPHISQTNTRSSFLSHSKERHVILNRRTSQRVANENSTTKVLTLLTNRNARRHKLTNPITSRRASAITINRPRNRKLRRDNHTFNSHRVINSSRN